MRQFFSLNEGALRRACCVTLASLAATCAWADDDAAMRKLGRDLFNKGSAPACALCHTLKDAGAQGEVGPVLDELKPDAARVAAALRNGIGQMPSYAGKLDEQQIATLASYIAKATGAAK